MFVQINLTTWVNLQNVSHYTVDPTFTVFIVFMIDTDIGLDLDPEYVQRFLDATLQLTKHYVQNTRN